MSSWEAPAGTHTPSMHVTILNVGISLVMIDWWSRLAMLGHSMEVLHHSTQNISPSIHGIKGTPALSGLFLV